MESKWPVAKTSKGMQPKSVWTHPSLGNGNVTPCVDPKLWWRHVGIDSSQGQWIKPPQAALFFLKALALFWQSRAQRIESNRFSSVGSWELRPARSPSGLARRNASQVPRKGIEQPKLCKRSECGCRTVAFCSSWKHLAKHKDVTEPGLANVTGDASKAFLRSGLAPCDSSMSAKAACLHKAAKCKGAFSARARSRRFGFALLCKRSLGQAAASWIITAVCNGLGRPRGIKLTSALDFISVRTTRSWSYWIAAQKAESRSSLPRHQQLQLLARICRNRDHRLPFSNHGLLQALYRFFSSA